MSDNQSLSFQTFLRGMSPSAFKVLGLHQLGYIKPTNDNGFELHAADGEILARFQTFEHALEATEAQDLKPVTVH